MVHGNSWPSSSLMIEMGNVLFFSSFWQLDLWNCVVSFMCMDSLQKLYILKVIIVQDKTSLVQMGVLF